MPIHSVPNSRLHCCLIILIVFILIFLSLPLLLIYLANTNFELVAKSNWPDDIGARKQDQDPNSNLTTLNKEPTSTSAIYNTSSEPQATTSSPMSTTTTIAATTTTTALDSNNEPTNCTQFAIKANLSLIGDNFHCPAGTFPCSSCPDICIEQMRQCNGVADCPDKSDELSCYDSNGAIRGLFQTIVNANKTKTTNQKVANLAKPDSCRMEDFLYERCPCVITDPYVIICEGLNYTSIPNTLLSSVYKIRMSNNSIESLDDVLWPAALTSLVLLNNNLKYIAKSTFDTIPSVTKLYLSYNSISYIHEDSFDQIQGLTVLQAEGNKLTFLDPNKLFKATPMIKRLYLGENQIQLPEETRFSSCCRYLTELLLDHNQISHIKRHWFSNLSSLIWLALNNNQITFIEDGSFDWNYELEELNLSFNRIKIINRLMFTHKLNIRKLYLGANPLKPLAIDTFKEIVNLRSLNLQQVEFSYIEPGTFSYLTQLDFIYFEKFIYCHYANHVRVCRPLTDGLSSVQELLAFPILKYAVWIVASVCSLGNVFVFIWRSISPHEDQTLSLFVRNLSIADLMMGIYLGAIGWQDWQFQHHFGRHAIEWMSSWKCTAIGFLAILSSELSVFILTIITIERYRSITSIRRHEQGAQRRRARLYVTLAWFSSLAIAIYPVVEWYLNKWPGGTGPAGPLATNGLCLPLHIDQPFTDGWQYSAFVYLGINFVAVMIIIALYVHMYAMIINGRQMARPVCRFREEKREDAILAIRFFFIVITDCLCWIPIVVIKIMALANFNISSSICGWLVVFIIPINSALNPILYTLAAPTSLRAAVCRLFERICDKLDSLTGQQSHNNQHKKKGSSYSHASSSAGSAATTTTTTTTTTTCGHLDSSSSLPHCMLAMPRRRRKTHGSSSASTCDTFETSIVSHKPSLELAALVRGKVDTFGEPLKPLANGLVVLDLASDLEDDLSDVEDDDDDDDDGDDGDDGLDEEEDEQERAAKNNNNDPVEFTSLKQTTRNDHMTDAARHRPTSNGNSSSASASSASSSNLLVANGASKQVAVFKKPYDCLSTYENNAIKHRLVDAANSLSVEHENLGRPTPDDHHHSQTFLIDPFGQQVGDKFNVKQHTKLDDNDQDDESSERNGHEKNKTRKSNQDKNKQCLELIHLDDDDDDDDDIDVDVVGVIDDGHHHDDHHHEDVETANRRTRNAKQVALVENPMGIGQVGGNKTSRVVSKTANRVSFDSKNDSAF